ncbi:amidohydrolase [Sciscionella sediminilitoris]|uniref:amidohydrolase n=1 Tax=Sciscionella sediminilitoris TaxID=1445613 RepID=UPI000B1EFFB9|nr:amidohydrolase [Sciscionella sp. SE31]
MSADTILVNARVHTLAPEHPHCDTIAIGGGRILDIGDTGLLAAHRDGSTEIVDLGGATVTPGLVDGHMHPIQGAETTMGIDFGGITDFATFTERLRAEAECLGPGEWVRGWNLDYALFAGRRISADSIEDAVHGLPCFLLFFDGHTALASHAALRLAGIHGGREFTDSSEIVLDSIGHPTGELREHTAYALVADTAPALSAKRLRKRVREILYRIAGTGLTGATVMNGDPATFDLLDELEHSGSGLPVRLMCGLGHQPGSDADTVRANIAARDRHGERWRGGLIKLFLDGVIDTGTAWLYEPDTQGMGGSSFWPDPGRYAETVRTYAEAGFQVATHAIGDRAIGAAIDAYLGAGVRAASGAPHRIEHLECLAEHDLHRLAAAGITASMQPLHMQWRAPDGSDSWTSRLDPRRAALAWRTGDVLRSGAPLALGSDWPVAQYDARIGLAWARLRREPGHPDAHVFEPAQRLSAYEALCGFTTGATRAQGDTDLGSIRPGNRADLTVWAQDPLAVSADELVHLPIHSTWIGGTRIYRAEN